MPTSFFKILDLGPGFDGLVVEGTPVRADTLFDTSPDCGNSPDEDVDLLRVGRVYDTNLVIGDRCVSSPVWGELYIGFRHLQASDDPRSRQYDSRNPWGKCLYEQTYGAGSLTVSCAQYERCLQVTVLDGRTLFSDYFFDEFEQVKSIIEQYLAEGNADDLVFKLRELKGVNHV